MLSCVLDDLWIKVEDSVKTCRDWGHLPLFTVHLKCTRFTPDRKGCNVFTRVLEYSVSSMQRVPSVVMPPCPFTVESHGVFTNGLKVSNKRLEIVIIPAVRQVCPHSREVHGSLDNISVVRVLVQVHRLIEYSFNIFLAECLQGKLEDTASGRRVCDKKFSVCRQEFVLELLPSNHLTDKHPRLLENTSDIVKLLALRLELGGPL
mmetsp:Transcript_2656/g.6393  ORF Transcript_2656/g.6393 Transcript_2656/m.6393 type:complete len:205 (+) Transcript_2656:139-753(+)